MEQIWKNSWTNCCVLVFELCSQLSPESPQISKTLLPRAQSNLKLQLVTTCAIVKRNVKTNGLFPVLEIVHFGF